MASEPAGLLRFGHVTYPMHLLLLHGFRHGLIYRRSKSAGSGLSFRDLLRHFTPKVELDFNARDYL
jgi:hypothetical protein